MQDIHQQKQMLRYRRRMRIRARVQGTQARPRLSVKRSLASLEVQIINDEIGQTVLGAVERSLKATGTKTDRARAFGKSFAEQAVAKGVSQVVFDRGGYSYHGRIKAFAEGAREGGLQF